VVSIIMLVCVIGFIGGITAAIKALGKKRFKKALVWVVIVIASGFIYQITGTSDMAKEQQELVDKQMDEEAPDQKDVDVVEKDIQPVSPNPKDITNEECRQIHYHMTYEEVRKIATYDGEITSSEQIGDELVQHVVWTNIDGSILEIVMKDNIVTNWWGVCERK
jgi:hypothetical protein